jgi:hypothetical protein
MLEPEIAMGYEMDGRGIGVRFPARDSFYSAHCPDRTWGLPGLISDEYRWFFPPGLKRPVGEADRSLLSSAEVKNTFVYSFTSPYVFMVS